MKNHSPHLKIFKRFMIMLCWFFFFKISVFASLTGLDSFAQGFGTAQCSLTGTCSYDTDEDLDIDGLDLAAFIINLETQTGWTQPFPTAYDTSQYPFTHLNQPGSRIFYISNDGNDTSAQIYFWDGSQIVDSQGSPTGEGNIAYGTDPSNPTGPIKPFQRWAYVAPRQDPSEDIGTPWDGTNYKAPGELRAGTRYGYPDWWLFKRGQTFDVYQDLLSYAQQTNPGLTQIAGGSLTMSGGKSETERQILGAYGDLSQSRPRFINPAHDIFIRRWSEPDPKHMAFLSLHLDGRGEKRGGGLGFIFQGNDAVDILLEDCLFEGTTGSSIQNTSIDVTFRRCVIIDSFRDDHNHIQGMFFYGNRDATFRLEECIFMRNGFAGGDPEITGWPPSGDQYFDVYNRNLYISGECDSMASGIFDTISMVGASGDQFRGGMKVERNFFYQGYVALGAHGGYPDADGPTGTLLDNVLLRFDGENTNDNRGHPGWGFTLTSGAYQVEVANNIVTGAQHEKDTYGLMIAALGWYCYSHVFEEATRSNFIHDNIFDTKNADGAIRVEDGVEQGNLACSQWSFPGVTGNTVSNNVLINEHLYEWENDPKDTALGTANDTLFENNTSYTDRSEAALNEGWPYPDRTLKTYLLDLGYTVVSDDGFIEFFNMAKLQRKGNWNPEFTAKSIVNYFRQGFDMEVLE
ncbi:MAG: hypothetical protein GY729_03550 [Desulfobacteraceae bacterium]|nr:hypothetical protein [Desulfobacteraceae bacterium]